jgi:hypothetical protein
LRPLLDDSKAAGADRPGDDGVFWNLKRWGAPLARHAAAGEKLSREETLAQALRLARSHAEVARVWPVVFAKNRRDVNLFELESSARRLGQKKALGFFLSLSGRLCGDSRLAEFSKRLRDGRVRKTEDFFLPERGARARKLAEEDTPDLARKWFFRMNMPLASFKAFFRKFVGLRRGNLHAGKSKPSFVPSTSM